MKGWHAKKYANKVHESKGHVLAKPHPYIFFTLQLVHESYLVAILQGTHTYMTDAYAAKSY